MKYDRFLILAISILILFVSCKKQTELRVNNCPDIPRKIQFSLYTDTDFSQYNGNITFTVSIRNANHQTLWDSVMPQMRVKDIPGKNNKIFIEKKVPGNDSSLLQVGFIYSIQDVGISWFWDQSKPCETLKKVNFNFK